MGEQIPSKLAASRPEFDPALVDSQTLDYEEMKGETRELGGERTQIDEERWREEESKEEHVTSTFHFAVPFFFLIEYLVSSFSLSPCDFRSLYLLPSFVPSLPIFCVQYVIRVRPQSCSAAVQYSVVTVTACNV